MKIAVSNFRTISDAEGFIKCRVKKKEPLLHFRQGLFYISNQYVAKLLFPLNRGFTATTLSATFNAQVFL